MAAIFQLRRGSGSVSLVDGELYLNKTSQSLQLGTGNSGQTITLAKMNDENIGSFLLTGDVKLSGSIYLGNEATDNISALGVFNTNLVPQNNTINVGTPSAYWNNIYANNIIGSISATNGILSGSSQITNGTGILSSSNATFAEYTSSTNQFTSSTNNRLTNLESKSASVDISIQNINDFTASQNSKDVVLSNWTESVDNRFTILASYTGSMESRFTTLASVTESINISITNLNLETASLESRATTLANTTGALNTFTASTNSRLNNLESKSASVDISISQLNSYTASLKNAIELTGSTVSFLGDIVVYGTQSVINSVNLEVADNMIYLNATSSNTNVDLGIIGNYNDGTYAHTGIYRDSSDGVWRVFKGYTPEPSGNIDLSHASFQLADFKANQISASVNGIGNVTTYSASVNTRLVNIESITSSLYSFTSSQFVSNSYFATTGSNVFTDNQFISGSGGEANLYMQNGSINTNFIYNFDDNLLISASSNEITMSASKLWLNGVDFSQFNTSFKNYTSSLAIRWDNLQTYTSSVNTKFNDLQTYTSSVNTRLVEIGNVTSSLISSASAVSTSVWNLYQISSSQSVQNSNLATYTSSVSTRLTEIGIVTGSLILSASAVSSSVWSLNRFSASATNSIVELYWTASDHEGRIDYLEALGGIGGGVSPNVRLDNLELYSASVRISVANINTATASLQTTSASVNTSITNINLFTASISTASLVTSIANLNVATASLQTTSASVNTSITNINLFTASISTASLVTSITQLNSWSASAKIELSNLESTTSSLNSFSSSINTTIKNKLNADGVLSGSGQIGNYVATITGTANQVIVAGSGLNNAAVTLSTPQSIATTSDVQFNNITASAGIRATGDIVAYYSSDERLKENVQPIQNALTKVELISGNTYDWKEGFDNIHPHKGNDVGVIAQEIEKVLPQVVIERDNGYKAVDYEKIVPLLIEAIKELSVKVKELEKN